MNKIRNYARLLAVMLIGLFIFSCSEDDLTNDLSKNQVSGYTVKQIEDVLSNTSSWDSWKNNLKNNYNNVTENNLDAVFNRW